MHFRGGAGRFDGALQAGGSVFGTTRCSSFACGSGRLEGDEVGELGVDEGFRRVGRFVEAREADDELARFDAIDGGADGVVEQGEEHAQRDGCKTICDEEPEGVEVLACVAGRLYHTEVHRARWQAKARSVAGEGILECAGGGVVALATVADYAGARGK